MWCDFRDDIVVTFLVTEVSVTKTIWWRGGDGGGDVRKYSYYVSLVNSEAHMASTFEVATRAAIQEILMNNVQETKFGYILTKESIEDFSNDIFDLFVTSRNLKSAGDRLLGGQAAVSQRPSGRQKGR